jgi:hypothetical protein
LIIASEIELPGMIETNNFKYDVKISIGKVFKKGYPIVTDDIIAIDFNRQGSPILNPGYPYIRLLEDICENVNDNLNHFYYIAGNYFSDASKYFSMQPIKLKRIYILEKSDKTKISLIKSQEKLIELIRHSTPNRIFKLNAEEDNFSRYINLIKKVPMFSLNVAYSLNELSYLINLVEEDLGMKKGNSTFNF